MVSRDDVFWAESLGVAAEIWQEPGVSVAAHARLLAGWNGAWSFRRNDRVVLSVPDAWVSRLNDAASVLTPDAAMREPMLAQLFAPEFSSLLGPAYQGHLEPQAFNAVLADNVRWVGEADASAIEQFRQQCGEEDWSAGGLDEPSLYTAAAFENGEIVAMCACRAWNDYACDPCVLTRKDQRGKGHAAAVASLVVGRALGEGKLLLYQTLESNAGAIGVARRLGYQQYARHYAVRLTS